MAFAISSHTLPRIKSFKDCEELARKRRVHLDARKERSKAGWTFDKLPLCHNHGRWSNQEHKRMEWKPMLKAWDLILYRSTVVRYYEDGRIMLNTSWNSPSTRNFFWELRPEGVWLMKTSYGRAYCIGHAVKQWDRSTYGDDVEWHEVNRPVHPERYECGQGLLIDEQGVVLNPMPWTVRKTVSNKERRKEIKAKLAPFLTWFDAMTKVGNSIKGVVVGAEEMEDDPGRGHGNGTAKVNTTAVTYMLDCMMSDAYDKMYENPDPEYEQKTWRRACWTALFKCTQRWFWGNRPDESKYDFGYAAQMKRYILETAFKLHDGYRDITVVTPPGEKP
jgi:hypothetical protein